MKNERICSSPILSEGNDRSRDKSQRAKSEKVLKSIEGVKYHASQAQGIINYNRCWIEDTVEELLVISWQS